MYEAGGFLAEFSEATTLLAKATEGSPRLHPRSDELRGIRRRRIKGNATRRVRV